MKYSIKRTALLIELIGILILILLIVSGMIFDIPFEHFSANLISELGKPFYLGILNKIGVVFWSFSIIINFFTYILLKNENSILTWEMKFLLYSCIFFGYFLLDELFELHGIILPRYIGIHQLIVLIIYGMVTFFYIFYFRKEISNSYFPIFFLAISFLAISVFTDIFSYLGIIHLSFRYLLDDGAKFLGTVNLFIYFFILGQNLILNINKSRK